MAYLAGLRKFIMAMAALTGGFWLTANDKDIEGFALMAAVVLGFYNGSNVGAKYVEARYAKPRPTDAQETDNEESLENANDHDSGVQARIPSKRKRRNRPASTRSG